MSRFAAAVLIAGGLVLTGCAALEAFVGALAPTAGQVAASTLAGAVAEARARGQLPADPRADALEERLRRLEAERCAVPDAGALTAADVAARLDRDAEERRALAAELRLLLAGPRPSLPPAPVLPVDAGTDASAEGGL